MFLFQEERKQKFWYLCAVFFLIMFNYNTLIAQTMISAKISVYIVFAFCFIALLLSKKIKFQKELIIVTVVLMAMIVISMIVNLDFANFNGYIIILLKILGAFFILHTFEKKLFFSSYVSAMTAVAIASLIITYIFPIFSLERFLPIVTNRMGIQFYFGILSFKIKAYGSFELRNYGLFSEPAVYCFYLFIGVLFSFNKDELELKDIAKIAIMSLTMITTFSPVGFASALVVYIGLVVYVFMKKRNGATKLSVLMMGIVSVLIFLFNSSLRRGFVLMKQKATLSTGTGAGRMMSIIGNLLQGLKTPIFGGGLASIVEQSNKIGFNTSTTGASFLGFGLFFMVFVIYLQIKSVYSVIPPKKLFLFICMAALFFFQINNHGLIQSDWFWIVTLIGVGGFEICESDNYGLQPGNS